MGLDWEKLAHQFIDPATLRVLEVIVIRTEKGMTTSPKWLADFLDEKLGNVSYHVRKLADVGVIEEVETEQRRGAVAHFYCVSKDWLR